MSMQIITKASLAWLFALCVLGGVRVADAQTFTSGNPATLGASGTISSSIEFTVDDNTLECGTLTPNVSTACQTPSGSTGQAQITVRANLPWALTFTDEAEGTPDVVNMINDSTFDSVGEIQVALVPSATQGNATNGQTVTIAGGNISTVEPFNLTMVRGAGSFSGYFTVTIAAQ